jgi:hypothetical protein
MLWHCSFGDEYYGVLFITVTVVNQDVRGEKQSRALSVGSTTNPLPGNSSIHLKEVFPFLRNMN